MNSIINKIKDKRIVDLYPLEKISMKIDNENIDSFVYKKQSYVRKKQTENKYKIITKGSTRKKEKTLLESFSSNIKNNLENEIKNIFGKTKNNVFFN